MNLLAKSCFAPGIISFISNLITSSGEEENASEEHNKDQWLEEYSDGKGQEIYRCILSTKMENKYFSEVVRLVFKRT